MANKLLVDWTHMSRRASGIERISAELFSPEAFAPLPVENVHGKGKLSMLIRQQLLLPAMALTQPKSVVLFPGYPPALPFAFLRNRAVLYVHDLFLITRTDDLNLAGRRYMAPQFKAALKNLRYFLTNSETTADELAQHVAADAEIRTYRPVVRDVFGLTGVERPQEEREAVVIGTVGTIEPRKNMLAAARICEALSNHLQRPVEFHIVGRKGWGDDTDRLSELSHVRMLGFLDDVAARQAIANFDVFLSASHDEGLGLPLLEAQYAGLPVIAPDQKVFREVLGGSGHYIDTAAPDAAAAVIAGILTRPNWQEEAQRAAAANIERWNEASRQDREDVIAFLNRRLQALG